jgi:hypothetical protein
MRTILSLSLVLFVATSSLPVKAEESSPGNYEVSTVPAPITERFITAVQNDSSWELEESLFARNDTVSGADKLIWSGSELSTSVTIADFALEFLKSATQSSYNLQVSIQTGQVLIRSSNPPSQQLAGGVIAPYSPSLSYRKFIPGGSDTGFILLIPKMGNPDWQGLVICPQNRMEKDGSTTFMSSGYKLNSVKVTPKAEIRAHQETGKALGKIDIKIQTSKNIPRAETFNRSIERSDPGLSQIYFADQNDSQALAQSLPFAGIKVFGELISPSGSRRVKTLEGLIQSMSFDFSAPIHFRQDAKDVTFGGDGCFAVLRGILFEESYL